MTIRPAFWFLCATLLMMATTAGRADDKPGDRRLSLYNAANGEELSIVYRSGEHYDRDALRQLNRFLRDTRNDEKKEIDPKLFELLYDLSLVSGNPGGVYEVVRAYRSPSLDEKLRKQGRQINTNEYHGRGKALDIRLQGTSLDDLKDAAVKMSRGGVGYYPEQDYITVDLGPVRFWTG